MAAQIVLAWIGRTRDRVMGELVDEYVSRASRLARIEVLAVRASHAAEVARRQREDMVALRDAAAESGAVLMTERGEAWNSRDLAAFLRSRLDGGRPTTFLVGGEEGFRPEDESWAERRLQLSRMTLPHELARVVLAEQVYRALAILHNVKYHK